MSELEYEKAFLNLFPSVMLNRKKTMKELQNVSFIMGLKYGVSEAVRQTAIEKTIQKYKIK